jgi:hypothetical protein
MTNPFQNGTIHEQDVRDRNIARQRIALAIETEAKRLGILVDHAITQINERPSERPVTHVVWNTLQRDEVLKTARLVIDFNVSDYPGFNGWVTGARKRIEEKEMNRLRNAIRKPEYQHRFANTVGFVPAFA